MDGDSLSLLTQKEANFESDMEKYLYQFLSDKNKDFLIVEGAVIYVLVKALSKLNLNPDYDSNAKYLGPNCEIDLLGEKLLATSESYKNLLVCHIQQAKQVDLSALEKTIIPKLKEESKKLIIVSPKNLFNDLKKLDCGNFLLIDEFNRKVHVDQYWTLYHSITFGFLNQLGKTEKGLNVNEPLYMTNEFPIHKAIKENHINVIHFLLACNVNLFCEDEKGRKPFQLALENGDEEVISVLLYKLNYEEWYEFLSIAVRSGKIQHVKVILKRNFNLKKDKTLLHDSVIYGHLDIVKLLVQKGVNVNNGSDSNWNTPLHLAVIHKRYDIVQYLVSQDAKANCRNRQNKTPQDLSEICPLLKQYFIYLQSLQPNKY